MASGLLLSSSFRYSASPSLSLRNEKKNGHATSNLRLHAPSPTLNCNYNNIKFGSSFFVDPEFIKIRHNFLQCKKTKKCGGALSSTCSISLTIETLRWVFSASAVLLMLLKNTPVNKAFIVPILALQAPRDLISWIRGEYGMWAVFLALFVRLFYYIPGELELPLVFLLVVITAPYQALNFRGTIGASILCIAIASYLGYQHVRKSGGVREVFHHGSLAGSLSVICLVSIPMFFLAQRV